MSDIGRYYSCEQCGNPFIAYPPDDLDTRAVRTTSYYGYDPKPKKSSPGYRYISYRCSKCSYENKLTWTKKE